MQDYRKLIAWQRAHGMTLAVHQVFARRPRSGLPGLSAQILRAAAATAANIAEGCGHRSSGELARFLDIAIASVVELDYHLLLARDLEMITNVQYDVLATEARDVRQLLTVLVRRGKDAGRAFRVVSDAYGVVCVAPRTCLRRERAASNAGNSRRRRHDARLVTLPRAGSLRDR